MGLIVRTALLGVVFQWFAKEFRYVDSALLVLDRPGYLEVAETLYQVNRGLAALATVYLLLCFLFRAISWEYIPRVQAMKLSLGTAIYLGVCYDQTLHGLVEMYSPAILVGLVLLIHHIWESQIRGPIPRFRDMKDMVVIVTGCNGGIGAETARHFATFGAQVVMLCRDVEKSRKAHEKLLNSSGNKNISLVYADLSSQESVERACDVLTASLSKVDVLINNAGLMSPKRMVCKCKKGEQLEMMMQVNHLAPFVVTLKLLPLMRKSTLQGGARIVNVNSTMHKYASWYFDGFEFDDIMQVKNYGLFSSYGHSKNANQLFTLELDRRLKANGDKISVNSLMPGTIPSGITRHFPVWAKYGQLLILGSINKTNGWGSYNSVFVGSSPTIDGVSGKYFEHSKIVPHAPRSNDEDQARRLWEISENLTHISSKDICGL